MTIEQLKQAEIDREKIRDWFIKDPVEIPVGWTFWEVIAVEFYDHLRGHGIVFKGHEY